MADMNNVSVRLDDNDYKKLVALKDKVNSRIRYGKASLADILRVAIVELYEAEFNPNSESDIENTSDNTSDNSTDKSVTDETDVNTNNEVETEVNDSTNNSDNTNSIDDQLKEYEQELRNSTNSKGKPYSESHIKRQLTSKRDELENKIIIPVNRTK